MHTQSKNLISNQFNIKWWNQKKKNQFKRFAKVFKKIIKIMEDEIIKKKLKTISNKINSNQKNNNQIWLMKKKWSRMMLKKKDNFINYFK